MKYELKFTLCTLSDQLPRNTLRTKKALQDFRKYINENLYYERKNYLRCDTPEKRF